MTDGDANVVCTYGHRHRQGLGGRVWQPNNKLQTKDTLRESAWLAVLF
jgi:hypothetical protein